MALAETNTSTLSIFMVCQTTIHHHITPDKAVEEKVAPFLCTCRPGVNVHARMAKKVAGRQVCTIKEICT